MPRTSLLLSLLCLGAPDAWAAEPADLVVCSDTGCTHSSLASALAAASNGDIIELRIDASAPPGTISKSVTIRGEEGRRPTLSCPATQVTVSSSGVVARVENVEFLPCSSTSIRPVNVSSGTLELHDVKALNGTRGPGNGGFGRVTAGGRLVLSSSELRGHSVPGGGSYGGHLAVEGATLEVVDSELSNGTGRTAGSIYAAGSGALIVRGSTFTGNSGTGGGAIYAFSASVDVSGSRFVGNSSSRNDLGGGGIYCYNDCVVHDSVFISNTAGLGAGGGVYGRGDMKVTYSTFIGNGAFNGGGVFHSSTSSDGLIQDSEFCDNVAGKNGGGAWVRGKGSSQVERSVFADNEAAETGGGVHGDYKMDLRNSFLLHNKAGIRGAGSYSIAGVLKNNLYAWHNINGSIAMRAQNLSSGSGSNAWYDNLDDPDVSHRTGDLHDQDPLLTNYVPGVTSCDDADYRPSSNSPLIDVLSGDQDSDGSPGDIGPYGSTDADQDGYFAGVDCNDSDPSVNPGAVEVCDEIDNDCDSSNDIAAPTWSVDADNDGFGDPNTAVVACTQPAGTVSGEGDDCDDRVGAINPGASETCDGVDNDCSGTADDDLDFFDVFVDGDEDGFGAGAADSRCDVPDGTVRDDGDCNDDDGEIWPGADELCDGLDNNCSGEADEELATLFYWLDADGDGFGEAGSDPVESCQAVDGHVTDDSDCNDSDTLVYPGAPEACDGVDSNCSGESDDDELAPQPAWFDGDLDGYGDAAIPGTTCAIADGYVANSADCDDTSGAVSPAASEQCNEVDDDCDGEIDEEEDLVYVDYWPDRDLDGFGRVGAVPLTDCTAPEGDWSAVPGDCSDTEAQVYPGAPELCDERDNDCDNLVDDQDPDFDPSLLTAYYPDRDGDGFGDGSVPELHCELPEGAWLEAAGDCDDEEGAIHPEADEVCNERDDDCDGRIDAADDDYTGEVDQWYEDRDGDGAGAGEPLESCTPIDGYVLSDDDCAPDDPTTHPGAEEVAGDEVDQDCDGDDLPFITHTYVSGGCSTQPTPLPLFSLGLLPLVPLLRRRRRESPH